MAPEYAPVGFIKTGKRSLFTKAAGAYKKPPIIDCRCGSGVASSRDDLAVGRIKVAC
jgi:hypothetical protein